MCRCLATSLALLALFVAVAIAGGLANRLRGGWLSLPLDFVAPNWVPSAVTHDLVARVIFAAPTALIILFSAQLRPKGWFFAFLALVFGLLSLFTGWGAYFSMGRWSASSLPRLGVFDWLVRAPNPGWDLTRRWVRDACGMALRGSMQTAVPGLAMYVLGYGDTYMTAGVMMAAVYEAALRIPFTMYSGFEQGVPLAEFMWGGYTWLVLLLVVSTRTVKDMMAAGERHRALGSMLRGGGSVNADGYRPLAGSDAEADGMNPFLEPTGGPAPTPVMRAKPSTIAKSFEGGSVHMLALAFEGCLAYSFYWYMGTPDPDATNQQQSLIGVAAVCVGLLALHFAALIVGIPALCVARDMHVDVLSAVEIVVRENIICCGPCWRCLQPFGVSPNARPGCARRFCCPTTSSCVHGSGAAFQAMHGLTLLVKLLDFVHAVVTSALIGLIVYGCVTP